MSDNANKDIKSLDKSIKIQIDKFFEKLKICENPRIFGEYLKGNLSGYFRYRVGSYRILCEIHDNTLNILVIEIGHRKNIYNNK